MQQQSSQLSSPPSPMHPPVAPSVRREKQTRSTAVLQANDPKRRSQSAHIPTFELPSHSTLGAPTLFPVNTNTLETRGILRQGHPHTTDRNSTEGRQPSSIWSRECATSRSQPYDRRSRAFSSRNNEEGPSDDEPRDDLTTHENNFHLSSHTTVPQRDAAGASRSAPPQQLPKLPPISVS